MLQVRQGWIGAPAHRGLRTGDSELKLDSGELVVGSRRYRTHGSGRLREHVRRVEEPMGLGRLHDALKRCRLLARSVALIYNWWSLFVRLADPEHHREAITSRPLLLTALARRTHHAGQVRLTVSRAHGEQHLARRAYLRIAGFMARPTAHSTQPRLNRNPRLSHPTPL